MIVQYGTSGYPDEDIVCTSVKAGDVHKRDHFKKSNLINDMTNTKT